MPSSGGAAGKVGDQYEALWAVDAAIRIIRGDAESIVYEPLENECSLGVEFCLLTENRETEYWSIKRQTTKASGWTLAILASSDPKNQGRSILGDLATHVERDSQNVAVFASTMAASELEELRSVSQNFEIFKQRLESSRELQGGFDRYLRPKFQNDPDRTRKFLNRLRILTVDEGSLRSQLETNLSLLFYPEKGGQLDAASVRRAIAEYLLDNLHQRVDRAALVRHLEASGIRCKDWKLDTKTPKRIADLCRDYTRPILNLLINGQHHFLPCWVDLFDSDGLPHKRTLICGESGSGKSAVSAQLVKQLCTAGIPILPIRFDELDEGTITPQDLGNSLSLPGSPVTVLVGLADGGDCVLLIDQLDAVSIASGRQVRLWNLFEKLISEADLYPNLRVVVSCRGFDLQHDHRIRRFASTPGIKAIPIEPLSGSAVDQLLGGRKVHDDLKPLLSIPLHLSMFLALEVPDSQRLQTRDELFDAFWERKLRDASSRRDADYVQAIDVLCGWLSERQKLSAPVSVLDSHRVAAEVLASEGVFIRANNQYRFFHESFFDYAYARSFVRDGSSSLCSTLLSAEQHLFRRAQVRQVLSHLRTADPPRYLKEVKSLLTDDRVRFHIKRLVLFNLESLEVPCLKEWRALKAIALDNPSMKNLIYGTVAGHAGWFDALEGEGFFDRMLSSDDSKDNEVAVWMFTMPKTMEVRSDSIASLLKRHRRDNDTWRCYLQAVCRHGWVYHSREMFDLFLSLIKDGTLDGIRPKFAVNDTWWSTLYPIARHAPALASEAIAAWFERIIRLWREEVELARLSDRAKGEALRARLDAPGDPGSMVANAAKQPDSFVRHLLPIIMGVNKELAGPPGEHLGLDELSPFRAFGRAHRIYDSVFASLALAMERLAQEEPEELDRHLDPFVQFRLEAVVYLTLRAWTANPDRYANRLAEFLTSDPRRLRIGYSMSSGCAGRGMAKAFRSIEAVRAASPLCSAELYSVLEDTLLNRCKVPAHSHAKLEGAVQYQLLNAMDPSRLDLDGRNRLDELKAELGNITSEPPRPWSLEVIGPPIADEVQADMTDDQWLVALETFAGVEDSKDLDTRKSGGERELANALEARTQADPRRFVALSTRMPVSLPASYFDAVIRGLANAQADDSTLPKGVALADVALLIKRAHSLEHRPCGRAITHLISRRAKMDWPAAVLEVLSWYATDAPDPEEEFWRKAAGGGQFYYDGDPDLAGLNSTRGGAAGAIGRLLFAQHESSDELLPTVKALACDHTIAVRSQAIECLLALLNTHPGSAIQWFLESVSIDPVLLSTRTAQHFLFHGSYRDPEALRPILLQMLSCDQDDQVKSAAEIVCRLALSEETWEEDADKLRKGTPVTRKAAAAVYVANATNQTIGSLSQALLIPFLSDPDESVQAEAATVFEHLSLFETVDQEKLLSAFLKAKPTAKALEPVIFGFKNSPVQMPDLVCRLVEIGVDACSADGGDGGSFSAIMANELSKIVLSLYTQSEDEETQRRCLDSIDVMETRNFYGLSEELGKYDR